MPLDMDDPEVKEAFDAAVQENVQSALKEKMEEVVSEATRELKSKNEELIGEKRKVTEKLQQFEGLDVEKLKAYQDQLEHNEDAKLLAEGKFEDVFNKRYEKFRNDYESKIKDLSEETVKEKDARLAAEKRAQDTIIDINLRRAAELAGVLPSAIDDVVARGKNSFVAEEDGSVVQRDTQGNLVTIDGKNATPDVWLKSLEEKAPHFWPSSQDGNLGGGTGPGNRNPVDEQLAKAAASGDIDSYRALRNKQRGIKND